MEVELFMFGWLTAVLFTLATGWLIILLWRERAYRNGVLTHKHKARAREKRPHSNPDSSRERGTL